MVFSLVFRHHPKCLLDPSLSYSCPLFIISIFYLLLFQIWHLMMMMTFSCPFFFFSLSLKSFSISNPSMSLATFRISLVPYHIPHLPSPFHLTHTSPGLTSYLSMRPSLQPSLSHLTSCLSNRGPLQPPISLPSLPVYHTPPPPLFSTDPLATDLSPLTKVICVSIASGEHCGGTLC